MLDPHASTPLDVQLMELLERQLRTGELEEGQRLPPERELARQYGVSIVTVRSAVGELCSRGLLERKQGKGTFVRSAGQTRDARELESFTQSCRHQGVTPGGQMLENRQVPLPDRVARELEQGPGSFGVLLRRLRFAGGEPVALEKNYFPLQYCSLLTRRFDNESLFRYLEEEEHVAVARADKRIELCHATSEEAQLLRVAVGAPMLLIRSVTYTESGAPLYVGTQVMNGERFSLHIRQYAGMPETGGKGL